MRDFSFRSYGFLPFGKRDKGERELNLKEQLTESHERRINPLKQLICVTFRGVTWGVDGYTLCFPYLTEVIKASIFQVIVYSLDEILVSHKHIATVLARLFEIVRNHRLLTSQKRWDIVGLAMRFQVS